MDKSDCCGVSTTFVENTLVCKECFKEILVIEVGV
jgi:hypothetical protein